MSERILARQYEAWNRKPSLRRLYEGWFREIASRLVPGRTLEVGAGIGKLKETVPGVTGLDLEPTPWTDMAGDAQRLPVRGESLGNIVLFDVLHHLPRPALFFREAERVLTPGGRIVIMDPYVSPCSYLVYRFLHPEGVDMACDPYDDGRDLCGGRPFDSNQAAATVMFFRQGRRWDGAFPGLRVLERRRLALLAYPFTGGFGGRTLLPEAGISLLDRAERHLGFLAPLTAFRTLVVIEKNVQQR